MLPVQALIGEQLPRLAICGMKNSVNLPRVVSTGFCLRLGCAFVQVRVEALYGISEMYERAGQAVDRRQCLAVPPVVNSQVCGGGLQIEIW